MTDRLPTGLRILMISDVYFPRVNGVSTSIRSFRRELIAQGHRVTLVVPDYPHAAAFDAEHPDADLIRIASLPIPRDPEDRLMRRRFIRALLPALRGEHFDVLHIQTPFVAHYAGVALARDLGIPVIESYHTFFEEYLYHYVPLLPKGLLRLAARRFTVSQCNAVAQVIAPSHAMLEGLRGYGVRTPITILPTGLETSQFKPGDGAHFRASHDIASDRPVALCVGRVAHEKNLDFLLRAFQLALPQVPDALLLIVGEGPAVTHLHRLAQQLQISHALKFIGYLDRDTTLLDCYASGDVFVFASRTETQGLVLLEALAQGTPVLSTAHMGTRDILAPDNRPIRSARIAPEQEYAFATALVELLQHPALRQQMAEHAVADAQPWSIRETTQRLVQLYRDMRTAEATESMTVG